MTAVPQFRITYVTERCHETIKALEGAVIALERAQTHDQKLRAGTALSLARESLYQYAESLEAKSHHTINNARTIQLRF